MQQFASDDGGKLDEKVTQFLNTSKFDKTYINPYPANVENMVSS
jgi:hypothetical protein